MSAQARRAPHLCDRQFRERAWLARVKVISQRLGHASIGITLDTYSHVLPAADANVAHTLAQIILGDQG
ncbi:MAG: hypothetical protein ACRDYA_09910 [Egibacteraceae bacterium]